MTALDISKPVQNLQTCSEPALHNLLPKFSVHSSSGNWFFIIAQCLQLLHELLCNFFIFMRWWHSSYFLPKGFSSLQTSYCEPRLLLDDAKLDCVNVSLVHMLCKLWSRPGSFFHPWPPTGLNTDSQSVKHRNHKHSVHYRTLWLHSSLLLYATWAMWIMDAVWHLSD